MKIDKILFVCDDNPSYLEFWPSVSKFYSRYLNMRPHLFFIGKKNDQNQKHLSVEHGEVTVIDPIPNIPLIIQALWGKFWFTQTEPDTTWLIGDIDLYLLNKDYLNVLNDIDSDRYVHLNANGYKCGNWWENPILGIPGYFHCAKGKVFKQFLQLSDTLEKDCRFIVDSKKYGILYNGSITDESHTPQRVKDKKEYGYICCEENLSTERLRHRFNEIVSITYPNSLVRVETPYASRGLQTPSNYNFTEIFDPSKKSFYIDFHSPRPYSTFASRIEQILNCYE